MGAEGDAALRTGSERTLWRDEALTFLVDQRDRGHGNVEVACDQSRQRAKQVVVAGFQGQAVHCLQTGLLVVGQGCGGHWPGP